MKLDHPTIGEFIAELQKYDQDAFIDFVDNESGLAMTQMDIKVEEKGLVRVSGEFCY